MLSQVEKGESPMKKFKPEKDKHGRYRHHDIVGTNRLIYEGYKAKANRVKKEKELEQQTSSSGVKGKPKFSPTNMKHSSPNNRRLMSQRQSIMIHGGSMNFTGLLRKNSGSSMQSMSMKDSNFQFNKRKNKNNKVVTTHEISDYKYQLYIMGIARRIKRN